MLFECCNEETDTAGEGCEFLLLDCLCDQLLIFESVEDLLASFLPSFVNNLPNPIFFFVFLYMCLKRKSGNNAKKNKERRKNSENS